MNPFKNGNWIHYAAIAVVALALVVKPARAHPPELERVCDLSGRLAGNSYQLRRDGLRPPPEGEDPNTATGAMMNWLTHYGYYVAPGAADAYLGGRRMCLANYERLVAEERAGKTNLEIRS